MANNECSCTSELERLRVGQADAARLIRGKYHFEDLEERATLGDPPGDDPHFPVVDAGSELPIRRLVQQILDGQADHLAELSADDQWELARAAAVRLYGGPYWVKQIKNSNKGALDKLRPDPVKPKEKQERADLLLALALLDVADGLAE